MFFQKFAPKAMECAPEGRLRQILKQYCESRGDQTVGAAQHKPKPKQQRKKHHAAKGCEDPSPGDDLHDAEANLVAPVTSSSSTEDFKLSTMLDIPELVTEVEHQFIFAIKYCQDHLDDIFFAAMAPLCLPNTDDQVASGLAAVGEGLPECSSDVVRWGRAIAAVALLTGKTIPAPVVSAMKESCSSRANNVVSGGWIDSASNSLSEGYTAGNLPLSSLGGIWGLPHRGASRKVLESFLRISTEADDKGSSNASPSPVLQMLSLFEANVDILTTEAPRAASPQSRTHVPQRSEALAARNVSILTVLMEGVLTSIGKNLFGASNLATVPPPPPSTADPSSLPESAPFAPANAFEEVTLKLFGAVLKAMQALLWRLSERCTKEWESHQRWLDEHTFVTDEKNSEFIGSISLMEVLSTVLNGLAASVKAVITVHEGLSVVLGRILAAQNGGPSREAVGHLLARCVDTELLRRCPPASQQGLAVCAFLKAVLVEERIVPLGDVDSFLEDKSAWAVPPVAHVNSFKGHHGLTSPTFPAQGREQVICRRLTTSGRSFFEFAAAEALKSLTTSLPRENSSTSPKSPSDLSTSENAVAAVGNGMHAIDEWRRSALEMIAQAIGVHNEIHPSVQRFVLPHDYLDHLTTSSMMMSPSLSSSAATPPMSPAFGPQASRSPQVTPHSGGSSSSATKDDTSETILVECWGAFVAEYFELYESTEELSQATCRDTNECTSPSSLCRASSPDYVFRLLGSTSRHTTNTTECLNLVFRCLIAVIDKVDEELVLNFAPIQTNYHAGLFGRRRPVVSSNLAEIASFRRRHGTPLEQRVMAGLGSDDTSTCRSSFERFFQFAHDIVHQFYAQWVEAVVACCAGRSETPCSAAWARVKPNHTTLQGMLLTLQELVDVSIHRSYAAMEWGGIVNSVHTKQQTNAHNNSQHNTSGPTPPSSPAHHPFPPHCISPHGCQSPLTPEFPGVALSHSFVYSMLAGGWNCGGCDEGVLATLQRYFESPLFPQRFEGKALGLAVGVLRGLCASASVMRATKAPHHKVPLRSKSPSASIGTPPPSRSMHSPTTMDPGAPRDVITPAEWAEVSEVHNNCSRRLFTDASSSRFAHNVEPTMAHSNSGKDAALHRLCISPLSPSANTLFSAPDSIQHATVPQLKDDDIVRCFEEIHRLRCLLLGQKNLKKSCRGKALSHRERSLLQQHFTALSNADALAMFSNGGGNFLLLPSALSSREPTMDGAAARMQQRTPTSEKGEGIGFRSFSEDPRGEGPRDGNGDWVHSSTLHPPPSASYLHPIAKHTTPHHSDPTAAATSEQPAKLSQEQFPPVVIPSREQVADGNESDGITSPMLYCDEGEQVTPKPSSVPHLDLFELWNNSSQRGGSGAPTTQDLLGATMGAVVPSGEGSHQRADDGKEGKQKPLLKSLLADPGLTVVHRRMLSEPVVVSPTEATVGGAMDLFGMAPIQCNR